MYFIDIVLKFICRNQSYIYNILNKKCTMFIKISKNKGIAPQF